MEKPQRKLSGLKVSPRGPKSPVESWSGGHHDGAVARWGGHGDMSQMKKDVIIRLGIESDDGSWRWIALSLPVVGRVVRRIQLAATPQDYRDPTWSLLDHESWAQRTAATVAADAARGYLL